MCHQLNENEEVHHLTPLFFLIGTFLSTLSFHIRRWCLSFPEQHFYNTKFQYCPTIDVHTHLNFVNDMWFQKLKYYYFLKNNSIEKKTKKMIFYSLLRTHSKI